MQLSALQSVDALLMNEYHPAQVYCSLSVHS